MVFLENIKRSNLTSWKGQVISSKYGNNLFLSLRLPLAVGACLGVVPIRGLWAGKHCFTWLHLRTVITAIVTFSLYLHTILIGHHFVVLIIKGHNSAGDLILIISGVWFYITGSLICTFFLLKSKQFCQYFDKWLQTSCCVSEYSKTDKSIGKHVTAITVILLLNCLGENVLYHFHSMTDERRKSLNLSVFLMDYYKSNQYMSLFFSYTPGITTVLLITNKVATFAWNFSDLILILVSRALQGKFKSLNRYVESRLDTQGSVTLIKRGSVSWRKIRSNFLLIAELLHDANRLLSPLIWMSFGTNIFFICRQLYEGLAALSPSQETLISRIYVTWSLILLIGRFMGVNIMASLMSEEAHRMLKVTQYCHPDEYDVEVCRLERFLTNRIIGITGNGCFTVTRSFLMKIISVLFTLEVVLLQNAHITVG